eukprot:584647-Prymnesium_polylepis.2
MELIPIERISCTFVPPTALASSRSENVPPLGGVPKSTVKRTGWPSSRCTAGNDRKGTDSNPPPGAGLVTVIAAAGPYPRQSVTSYSNESTPCDPARWEVQRAEQLCRVVVVPAGNRAGVQVDSHHVGLIGVRAYGFVEDVRNTTRLASGSTRPYGVPPGVSGAERVVVTLGSRWARTRRPAARNRVVVCVLGCRGDAYDRACFVRLIELKRGDIHFGGKSDLDKFVAKILSAQVPAFLRVAIERVEVSWPEQLAGMPRLLSTGRISPAKRLTIHDSTAAAPTRGGRVCVLLVAPGAPICARPDEAWRPAPRKLP